MIRPNVDPAALDLARRLFREWIGAAQAVDRARTSAVRGELERALAGVAHAFELADLDGYFVARVSARAATPSTAAEAAQLVAGLRHASPLWVAGVADALLESIGAAP